MNPSTIQLALGLLDIIQRASATLNALKANDPEVYAHIAQHHAQALQDAQAAL